MGAGGDISVSTALVAAYATDLHGKEHRATVAVMAAVVGAAQSLQGVAGDPGLTTALGQLVARWQPYGAELATGVDQVGSLFDALVSDLREQDTLSQLLLGPVTTPPASTGPVLPLFPGATPDPGSAPPTTTPSGLPTFPIGGSPPPAGH